MCQEARRVPGQVTVQRDHYKSPVQCTHDCDVRTTAYETAEMTWYDMKRQMLELEASWGAEATRIFDRIIEEGIETRVYH